MKKMPNKNYHAQTITIDDLERAVKTAGRVVALYGETYLPIFNRLHDELIKAKEAETIKTLALQFALDYSRMD